jgi:hypothetical protein
MEGQHTSVQAALGQHGSAYPLPKPVTDTRTRRKSVRIDPNPLLLTNSNNLRIGMNQTGRLTYPQ